MLTYTPWRAVISALRRYRVTRWQRLQGTFGIVIYTAEDYIFPLWRDQATFDADMTQRRADFDKTFGAGSFAKNRADQKEWQAAAVAL